MHNRQLKTTCKRTMRFEFIVKQRHNNIYGIQYNLTIHSTNNTHACCALSVYTNNSQTSANANRTHVQLVLPYLDPPPGRFFADRVVFMVLLAAPIIDSIMESNVYSNSMFFPFTVAISHQKCLLPGLSMARGNLLHYHRVRVHVTHWNLACVWPVLHLPDRLGCIVVHGNGHFWCCSCVDMVLPSRVFG